MEHLKLLRHSLGLSQQKLAEKLNTTQQSIYKYENDVSQPDIQTLKAMSHFFQVSIDYIVGNSDVPALYGQLIDDPNYLSAQEVRILQRYRILSESRRKLVDSLIEDYASQDSPN
ncbi:MAG: helix-turn-helix transcriptional regulator [Eubacteriales bacterium]|nr:helix-turn-helix transcriptional regulator [Eubacteriales bacterium]